MVVRMAHDWSGESWAIEIGDQLRRSEVHARYGGATQWGITSCMNGNAVLVFVNPKKSAKFGYDKWEGPRPNGRYDYTGQGPEGDQSPDRRANKSLLLTQQNRTPIYLFEAHGPIVTFKGVFRLEHSPFRYERAPDINGNERRVIVFSFIRMDTD